MKDKDSQNQMKNFPQFIFHTFLLKKSLIKLIFSEDMYQLIDCHLLIILRVQVIENIFLSIYKKKFNFNLVDCHSND